jgi:spore coat protein CotH
VDTNSDGIVEPPDPVIGPATGALAGDDGTEYVSGFEDFTSESLFDESRLPEFRLEMTDEALNDLRRDPYEYTEAVLVYEGRRYGPIAIRTKGENSWRPFAQKSSFKLDFNRFEDSPGRFGELKGLTFNAMNEDYSMMHERVAYKLYRESGVPAARAHHAIIYLNDELYGLFVMIDTIDDVFLGRWFSDTSGSMFEQHDGDLTDDYVQDNVYFQLEEGEDNRTALQGLADALEGTGPDALAAAGQYLDWDAFHRYWAAGSVVMNFDAYPFRFAGDDCHLYFDPERGGFVYIPHGVDESWYSDDNFEGRAAGHIAAKCREVDDCRNAWAGRVYDALDVLESGDFKAYAEQVRDQIEPWVEADPERNYPMDYVRYYQEDMINKIESRRSSVEYWIGPRP